MADRSVTVCDIRDAIQRWYLLAIAETQKLYRVAAPEDLISRTPLLNCDAVCDFFLTACQHVGINCVLSRVVRGYFTFSGVVRFKPNGHYWLSIPKICDVLDFNVLYQLLKFKDIEAASAGSYYPVVIPSGRQYLKLEYHEENSRPFGLRKSMAPNNPTDLDAFLKWAADNGVLQPPPRGWPGCV